MENHGFRNESWVGLYRSAMLELEHAKMTGRIYAARTEIVSRLEKLHGMPGLHKEERQAIEDALSGLRVLTAEDARYHVAEKQRVLDRSLAALKRIGSAIHRLDPASD
jgi:hypothetical protein